MILPYFLIITFTLIFCITYYKKVGSNKRFYNPDPTKGPLGFRDLISWTLSIKRIANRRSWPKEVVSNIDVPPAYAPLGDLRISFVGHATFLLQFDNLNILTDPVWSERASPISFLGPKRVTKPGIDFDQLPRIDVVIISHNHYDHLDMPTLKKLCERDQPLLIAPLGNEKLLTKCSDKSKIISLNWAESFKFSDELTIYLEPAQHWSSRSLWDKNKALWGTFIMSTSKGDICFIGDSGYSSEIFKQIGSKYNIYIGIIPIGAYEPRKFMKNVHMNPEEAIKTFQDLGAEYAISSHFETFPLADDAFNQPANELKIAIEKYDLNEEKFILSKIGKAYKF